MRRWLSLLLLLLSRQSAESGSSGHHHHAIRLLAVFRPRSSLTSRIHPIDDWQLPLLELQERWRTVKTLQDFQPHALARSETHLLFKSLQREGFECFRYIEVGASEVEGIVEAARCCVLLHGLYQLYAEHTISAAPSDAWTPRCHHDSKYYTLAGTLPSQPWIPNTILHDQWLDPFHECLTSLGKERVTSPSFNQDYARYQIFGDPHDNYVYFCKELVRGIAAPKHGYLNLIHKISYLRFLNFA